MKVSLQNLKELLFSTKGSSPVTIDISTDPKLLKKHRETKQPCPFDGIRKVSKINGMVGVNYETSVNRQRLREDSEADFFAKPRSWGFRVTNNNLYTPLVSHKGRDYMEVKVEKVLSTRYEDQQGRVISPTDLEGYLPASSSSANQLLENPVILRDVALENVLKLRFKGQEYEVTK